MSQTCGLQPKRRAQCRNENNLCLSQTEATALLIIRREESKCLATIYTVLHSQVYYFFFLLMRWLVKPFSTI